MCIRDRHYAGDGGAVSPTQQGPTYYTWHYRLPPFVEGLALEGESGDPRGGPEALLRAARLKKLELQQEQLQEERATALRARVAEAAQQPWYRDYFPEGEVDPATGEVTLVDEVMTLDARLVELAALLRRHAPPRPPLRPA